MTGGHAVTLDVGGSHVTAARVSLAGRRVRAEARRTLGHDQPLQVLLDGWAAAALEVAAGLTERPSHLGIAVPGPFDLEAGVSWMTHKFTLLDGVPAAFGNDADLFALGEWWAGAGAGTARMIGLTLGTGLGSGFVEDGRAVTSGPGVPPGGELWNVPHQGALAEAWASGAALTRAWAARTGEEATAREIAERAGGGDARAQAVFAAFGDDLAEILRPWVTRFGAQRVVLGGNVSRAALLFAPVLQAGLPGCEVRVSEHFERAGLLGAAALPAEVRLEVRRGPLPLLAE